MNEILTKLKVVS